MFDLVLFPPQVVSKKMSIGSILGPSLEQPAHGGHQPVPPQVGHPGPHQDVSQFYNWSYTWISKPGIQHELPPVGKPGSAPGRHQPGPPHGGHPGPKHTVPGP